MKQRPILFSTPMIRAILNGSKTQTRRLIKGVINNEPDDWQFEWMDYSLKKEWRFTQKSSVNKESLKNRDFTQEAIKCPYGKAALNDQLWVRETWVWEGDTKYTDISPLGSFYYKADFEEGEGPTKWKPSIFMPKEACRIYLEVTDLVVERLQDISEEEAKAEGVNSDFEYPVDFQNWALCGKCGGEGLHGALGANLGLMEVDCYSCDTHKKRFRWLWESINGPESWEANPWVWKVSFKRIEL